ncbi:MULTISPECIES: MarR family winged helix-turn-helix transcriptional regulator [Anaerotignum]|uniref:MarR family winged helix-turn-helix transcriptional regulator n=1 Tax=Anaerotignum TaxID=2039240 RepID=UPI00210BF08D|nr:MarR family transcriptional regulator [Anaerotignum sp.]MCQ4936433.1 MarR family transcriptional regulator [Anaerotignum propionicum]
MDFEQMAQEYLETMYYMRKINSHKEIHDSVHGENFVLLFISQRGGKVIPSDISNEMGISTARVAAALNSLEKKGLIIRRIDAEDRRRILIDLTDSGMEQVKNHYSMVLNMVKNMLHFLGEKDAKEFIRIMKRLAEKGPEGFK